MRNVEEKRVGEEEQIKKEQIKKERYRLAAHHYGNRGAALVTQALGASVPADVYADLRECIADDNDPGHVLWRPY
jgi:hypothetical protein